MNLEKLNKIIQYLNELEHLAPNGIMLLQSENIQNAKDLISVLNKIFRVEEKAIEAENSKKFTTYDYEERINLFAILIMDRIILDNRKLFKHTKDYEELLTQRHMAYALYNSIETDKIDLEFINENINLRKQTYLGLVKFYNYFYGRFSNNEEAIKLLCKFYTKELELKEDENYIINTIFKHMSNAGAPGDKGYAYNGISTIKHYVKSLPQNIVVKILEKYELIKVINEKVYRNQIFTIINFSNFDNQKKHEYKFSFLDSIIIANLMNRELYKKYKESEANKRNKIYLRMDTNLSVEKIEVIQDEKEEVYAYWTNEHYYKRSFVVDNINTINIRNDYEESKIYIEYVNTNLKRLEIKFLYEDWLLNEYNSIDFENRLYSFIHEEDSVIPYRNFKFSLLYLNEYRGIENQVLNFDRKFNFEITKLELKQSNFISDVSHFYGKSIYSLSCIVGRNGTGKSSTIEFLKSTFFKLIILIKDHGLKCDNGFIKEDDYKQYNIIDVKSEFLVVFFLNEQSYYLTNIKDTIVESPIIPFESNTLNSNNELSKVVYFSNMIDKNYENFQGEMNKDETTKALNNFRQVDYSESASFIERYETQIIEMPDENNFVNKDLMYQLTFLMSLTLEDLDYLFDITDNKVFYLYSNLYDKREKLPFDVPLEKLISDYETELKFFLKKADARIEYFSSGQFAKFSFLSKLYWFLKGYKVYPSFKKVLGLTILDNTFDDNHVLLEGEDALLFIDEGELYYHPEWQRNFIQVLTQKVNENVKESKLQIVLTTNSPFIISDILEEDITYLSKTKKNLESTLGQNIHTLLIDNFFMSYTIGEYSRQLIKIIIDWLSEEQDEAKIGEGLHCYFGGIISSEEYYSKIRLLISKIGEPVYREKLFEMLNNSKWGKMNKLENLILQKLSIEAQIKQLEES